MRLLLHNHASWEGVVCVCSRAALQDTYLLNKGMKGKLVASVTWYGLSAKARVESCPLSRASTTQQDQTARAACPQGGGEAFARSATGTVLG